MNITMDAIKKLRQSTGAGVMDAKKALEESKGDAKKAKEWIAKKGLARAEKKQKRLAAAGIVFSYVHHNQLTGSLIELNCETDFVAETDDFQNLAKEIAMQVNSMNPSSVKELEKQEYIRDPKFTIGQLIKQTAGKLGENIKLSRFERFEVGQGK